MIAQKITQRVNELIKNLQLDEQVNEVLRAILSYEANQFFYQFYFPSTLAIDILEEDCCTFIFTFKRQPHMLGTDILNFITREYREQGDYPEQWLGTPDQLRELLKSTNALFQRNDEGEDLNSPLYSLKSFNEDPAFTLIKSYSC